jgi:iron complex outermembrane receptor protein
MFSWILTTKRLFRGLSSAFLGAVTGLVLSSGAFTAQAQAPASAAQIVSGKVTDASGAVIVGASVTLRASSGGFARSVATDASGQYRFEKVPAGSYVIRVSRDGFAPGRTELRVSSGEPTTLDISLQVTNFAEEVTVSFTGEHAQTALKSDAPVRDIPMTVKSYTSSFIKAVDSKQMADLYTYMNGVNRAGDGVYDITMRGFEGSGADSGNVLYNGLPGLAGRLNSPNVANIERIEILKGPASVLYGLLRPAGLVNIITHRPQAERQHLFDFRTGTFFGTGPSFGDRNSFRAATDLTGPLGNSTKFLYRLTAAYDNAKSFRDFTDGEEIYVVPSATWNASAGTILIVESEYRRTSGAFDNGLIAPRNDINFVAPITTRYQEPDDWVKEQGWTASTYLTKLFSGGVSWNLNWRGVFHHDQRVAFENNRVENDNRRVRRRYRNQLNQREYNFLDTTVRKSIKTGSVEHGLLFGLNGGREQQDFDSIASGDVGFFVDLRHPVYGQQPPANPTPGAHTVTDYYRLGTYLQDQITFSSRWKGLASVRYDVEDQHIKELRLNNPAKDNTVGAAVPTAGVVFQPDQHWSIYGSFAQSFLPPPASAQDINGRNDFVPERGRQFEGGVKAELAQGRVDATAALFHIKKNNVLVPGPAPGTSEQIGQERSRGLEFDLRLRPVDHWQTILGYTYVDAVVTKDSDLRKVGARLRNTSKHAFNLWSRYDISSGRAKGLGFGLGLIRRGDRAGSFPDQVVVGNPIPGEPFPSEILHLPGYFRADAGIYYVRERYELTLRVNNIADELYYESAFNLVRIRPGNPREATLSARLRF